MQVSEETRKERERAFHDETFRRGSRGHADTFYAVVDESRNHYYRLIRRDVVGLHVLEYGCGPGSQAFDLAARGAFVQGIDISPVAIEQARDEARRTGVEKRADFQVMDAESTTFAPHSFDLIVGTGILHHLDLRRSYAEIARLLRTGGRAVFFEPLGHNPLINAYRRATPNARTPDEHPLVRADFTLAREFFGDVHLSFYHLTAIAAAPFARTPAFRLLLFTLSAFDRILFAAIPPLRPYAWMVVMEMRQPLVS